MLAQSSSQHGVLTHEHVSKVVLPLSGPFVCCLLEVFHGLLIALESRIECVCQTSIQYSVHTSTYKQNELALLHYQC